MTLELSAAGAITAFAAGAISFLSPCVLPLVPAYVSYVAGQSITRSAGGDAPPAGERLRILLSSLSFVLGFTTIFVALGAGISALSFVLGAYRYQINILSGALVILFGIFTTGLWRPAWAERDTRMQIGGPGSGPGPAYLLGLAFAFGWTPCIGPVLGAILAAAASSTGGSGGIALLTMYSLGLGLPFVMAALFFGSFAGRLGKFRNAGRVLQMIAGAVMIAMGLAMITGHLTDVAIWFLETFPMLGRIG